MVDGSVANIVVELGVDKIGGIMRLDEIHTVFVQGDLVLCCMTP